MIVTQIFFKNILAFYLTITIPFFYLLNVFLIYYFSNTLTLPYLITLFGISIAIIGVFFWITSFLTLVFSKSFGILPQKQKRIKIGIYKYFKHPMYIGIFFTFIGLSLANQSKIGLIFTILVISPLLIIRAIYEDKNLHD